MGASRNGSVALFVLALLVLDGAVVVALDVSQTRTRAVQPATAGPGVDLDWALCQTRFEDREVTPASVAVTYLDAAADANLTADQVRQWFDDLDGSVVQVYQLEYRTGRRLLALELARDRWPEWDHLAGSASGREVCGRLRAALLARGIGRPDVPDDRDRSRYDFEFIHERRSKLYRSVSWIGTLDDLLQADRFDAAKLWLAEGGIPR